MMCRRRASAPTASHNPRRNLVGKGVSNVARSRDRHPPASNRQRCELQRTVVKRNWDTRNFYSRAVPSRTLL
jgi:hypothetical protein